jgi:hypothetical protein
MSHWRKLMIICTIYVIPLNMYHCQELMKGPPVEGGTLHLTWINLQEKLMCYIYCSIS